MARNRYEFTNDPSISSKFSAYVQRIRKMTFFESSAHRIEMENFFVIFVFSNSVVVIVVVECNNIFFFFVSGVWVIATTAAVSHRQLRPAFFLTVGCAQKERSPS